MIEVRFYLWRRLYVTRRRRYHEWLACRGVGADLIEKAISLGARRATAAEVAMYPLAARVTRADREARVWTLVVWPGWDPLHRWVFIWVAPE